MKKASLQTSRITSKFQTVIPAKIRKTANLKINEEINWHAAPTKKGWIVIITPKQKNWSEYLSGLGKNVWKNINTDTYLSDLRKEWKK